MGPHRLILSALLLASLSACRSLGGGAGPVEGFAPGPDGVAISYQMRGRGELALVFLHGWGCSRAHWRNQLEEFAADHRVVAIDLPGHGSSRGARERWSILGLAGDVQAVVEQLDLRRVILVGHSMGGPVALEAARRMPGRVEAVIGVDTLHDAESRLSPERFEEIAGMLERDFRGALEAFVRSMFEPASDPAGPAFVVEDAERADRRALRALFRQFPGLDLGNLLAGARVPVRCINAAAKPPNRSATAVATNRKYADFDAVLIEGVGHWPMLEKPAEFNAKLREVLRGLPPRRSP